MIHVMTVHWKDDKWIDVQQNYLKRNIKSPYLVYAFLNYLPKIHKNKFFIALEEPIKSHAVKLNILSEIAIHNSNEEDILVFIDGDAFPVNEISEFIISFLTTYPLIAVVREENLGDCQPHPCFCATTVKFWKEIEGDWKEGYTWKNEKGITVTDVGGNLLKILKDNKIEWLKLKRSNKINLHPIWFGLYNDLIYHHGAGFRTPVSRSDFIITRSIIEGLLPSSISSLIKNNRLIRKIRNSNKSISRGIDLSDNMYNEINIDFEFYKKFI
jgi:hypothetical protein